MTSAQEILALTLSRPPTLGTGRLICIDGPAGSGKTTLAAAIACLTETTVVHMDDLYEGWDGLPRIDAQLATLLLPLAAGSPGRYRRWDWHTSAFAETVSVPPSELLVLEGVGSGSAAYAPLRTVLVFVDAPHQVRMHRGIDRDGDAFAPHWEAWGRDEVTLFGRERTRGQADVLVVTG